MVPGLRAAVAVARRTRPDVRPDAIGVAGASLGANLAALAAADQPSGPRGCGRLALRSTIAGVRVGAEVMKKLGRRGAARGQHARIPMRCERCRSWPQDGVREREQRSELGTARRTARILLTARARDLARALVDGSDAER